MSDAVGAGVRRVALISDTHLPRPRSELPPACVAELRASDMILHAGDLITIAVLRELKQLGPPVVAVHGNVDEPALRKMLPARCELCLGGVRFGAVHDAGPARGRVQRLRRWFPECSVVVFGHSHIPVHEHDDGFQIFNPGSPTDPRRQPSPTMGRAVIERATASFELLTI